MSEEKQYPSNSKTTKVKQEVEKPKVEAVVQGKVTQKKKTGLQRVGEAMLSEDSKTVGQYILYDVLIPALKSMLNEMVTSGMEVMLFGERGGGRGSGRSRTSARDARGRSYVSYSSYSDARSERSLSRRGRAAHEFDEIVFESRAEASNVLEHLVDLIIDYGNASVGDFYDLAGIDSSYTDQKYGWTSLREAFVERTRDGYIIDFPRTREID